MIKKKELSGEKWEAVKESKMRAMEKRNRRASGWRAGLCE